MILSASRRTDLPALYGPWLVNRLRAGEVWIPQPYRPRHAIRLLFSPETVDAIVFWTKNPIPFLPLLDQVEALGYRSFVFQYTITALGNDWEPGLPPLEERVKAFQQLSRRLGPGRMDWRFDPIVLDGERTPAWYARRFSALCRELAPWTTRCVLSFADHYAHNGSLFQEAPLPVLEETAARLQEAAAPWGLPLYTCAEAGDFSPWGIHPGACVDGERLGRLLGCSLRAKRDPGQRPACGCVESVDIGVYNTCVNGCKYCYATRSPAAAKKNYAAHDPALPMLAGRPGADWTFTEKRPPSLQEKQLSLL